MTGKERMDGEFESCGSFQSYMRVTAASVVLGKAWDKIKGCSFLQAFPHAAMFVIHIYCERLSQDEQEDQRYPRKLHVLEHRSANQRKKTSNSLTGNTQDWKKHSESQQ